MNNAPSSVTANLVPVPNLWHRLNRWLRPPTAGRLQAIFVSFGAGQPMAAVDAVNAIADAGLEGDRYCKGDGFWRATDACQVTLITARELGRVDRRAGVAIRAGLAAGSHRRNLVVDGLSESQLRGRCFRVGSAVFRYNKPRPPCGYIDRVAGSGVCKALGRDSGACVDVVEGGLIAVGDRVELLDE